MFGAMIHGDHDVRFEERPDPVIEEPTDAVVRTVATCVCGSDLWRYRGIAPVDSPTPIGHEYVGVVEEIGSQVTGVRPGDLVVGGFTTSDNTCPVCRKGMQSACLHAADYDGCQAQYIRVMNASGTLVTIPDTPDTALMPSLLALSDVMCTGWHAAVSAGVEPGCTAVVVGDGAVGLCAVLAAQQLGAEKVIAMSRHADRQAIARKFGATHIIPERGDEGVARVRDLTDGIGADAVLECVGTADSVDQALRSVRPGGQVGWVGVPHVEGLPLGRVFRRNIGLRGGIAPVRAYLDDLLARVMDGRIDPGRVFTLTLPLSQVAEGYAAMDERRTVKTMLIP